jgi:hypothetical protein
MQWSNQMAIQDSETMYRGPRNHSESGGGGGGGGH